MRSSLPVSLLSLLLPTLAASAATPQCLNSRARGLAGRAVCGDKETLLKCFQKSADDSESVIEDCLTKAGCTQKAAANEASYLFSFCQGEPVDLKRREREALAARDTTTADSTTTTDASTTATTGTSAVSKRQTTDTTATSTTAAATTTAATTDAAGTTTAASTANSDCSTNSVTTVSSCDSANQYDCSMVETTTMVCRSNYYCDTDASGNNLCMVRQDGLTTSGAVVAIFLAVCMTAIIATIIFLCCRDRKEQKRMRARAEAAAIAKDNALPKPDTTRSASQRAHGGAAEPNPFAG